MKAKPEEAIKDYEGFISNQSVNLSIHEYQKQLESQIENLKTNPYSVLTEDSIAAFPYVYDRLVCAVVKAHQELARIYMMRKEFSKAELNARKALERAGRWFVSPIVMAQISIECQDLLKEIYDQQGKLGKGLLSKLNRDLLKDYLNSEQGRKDYYITKKVYSQSRKQIENTDKFVKQVNTQRIQDANQQFDAIVGAMSSAMSTFQQHQINQALTQSGGVPTLEIQQMQTNKMLFDLQRQILSITSEGGKGVGAADSSLNPFSNLTVVQQLINPSYGVNPQGIIKTFASAVSGVSKNENVKRAADEVSQMADSVVAIRQGGNIEQTMNEVSRFANSFTSFQSQVQEIRADMTK